MRTVSVHLPEKDNAATTSVEKIKKNKMKLHFVPVGVKITASHEVQKIQWKVLSQKGRN